MKKLFAFILISSLILNSGLQAQNKYKEFDLKNIHGSVIIQNNESLEKATERAVNEAKVAALKQVGIEENITSFSDYFQSENNGEYEELFTNDILSDIRGAVKNINVIDTKKSLNEFEKIKIDVIINCTVIKYFTEKDLSFNAWVEGVGLYYQNETNLLFKIKPSQNAFVNIFIFNETEAFRLFPNAMEKAFLMNKDVEYAFPSFRADYVLYTEKKSEAHRMIMVFTKEEIPYTDDIEYKKIIDWVFSIPPDMRAIKSFGFSVVQEKKLTE